MKFKLLSSDYGTTFAAQLIKKSINRDMAREAVLETVNMKYDDDGILYIRINEGASIGLAQAKLQYETILRLTDGKKIPVVIDARSNHSATKEAQEFVAAHVGNRIATAVISTNPVVRVTLNIYTSVFKPASTYRMFTSEEKALKWLNEMCGKIKD